MHADKAVKDDPITVVVGSDPEGEEPAAQVVAVESGDSKKKVPAGRPGGDAGMGVPEVKRRRGW